MADQKEVALLTALKGAFEEFFGILLALGAVCFLFTAAWVLFYGLPCVIAILLGAS